MKTKTANKNVTIKGASDDQLVSLINRLRREAEAQDLIRRLKVNSKTKLPYEQRMGEVPEYDKGIDLSTPVKDLYHFGIKGQKWGVRRGRNVAKKYGTDTDVKSLSDTELNKRLNRIRMEQQYKQLTAPKKSAGKAYVENLLKSAGNEVAKDFVTSVMKEVVKGPKTKAIAKISKEINKKR